MSYIKTVTLTPGIYLFLIHALWFIPVVDSQVNIGVYTKGENGETIWKYGSLLYVPFGVVSDWRRDPILSHDGMCIIDVHKKEEVFIEFSTDADENIAKIIDKFTSVTIVELNCIHGEKRNDKENAQEKHDGNKYEN